ncbi:hypothetical protein BR93DRAFT_668387 [Coniochaeta sp. PMI_546]|nr:hypothetical protein BR93DRAFT_668387 [Coniochaeta sp. PMI_546]
MRSWREPHTLAHFQYSGHSHIRSSFWLCRYCYMPLAFPHHHLLPRCPRHPDCPFLLVLAPMPSIPSILHSGDKVSVHPEGSNRSLLGHMSRHPGRLHNKYIRKVCRPRPTVRHVASPSPSSFTPQFFTQDHRHPPFIFPRFHFKREKTFSCSLCARSSSDHSPVQLRTGFSSYSLFGLSRLGCNGRKERHLFSP